MGPVKFQRRAASLRYLTAAFPPERVKRERGLKGWQRPAPPVAQQRKSKPLAEQESDRGGAGARGAWGVKQACPATLVGPRADRAGDLQEWGVDARRRAPRPRAAVLSRAKGQRRRAPHRGMGGAERQRTDAGGTIPRALARQPARPPRPVTHAVTAQPGTGDVL
jgi:hypothetical protein